MLIIFISFSILALIIGSNMTAMTVENKRQSIDHSAENISGMITNLYKPVSADDFRQQFSVSDDGLSGYAKHLSDVVGDVRIYLIDASGKMILPAKDYESKTFKMDQLPEGLLTQLKSDSRFRATTIWTARFSITTSTAYVPLWRTAPREIAPR